MRIGKFPANGWMKCSGVVSGVKTCQDQLSWNFGRSTWETRRFARYKKGSPRKAHVIVTQTSNTANAVFVPRQVYKLEGSSLGTYMYNAHSLRIKSTLRLAVISTKLGDSYRFGISTFMKIIQDILIRIFSKKSMEGFWDRWHLTWWNK